MENNIDIEKIMANVLGEAGKNLAQKMSTHTLDDVSFHDFMKFDIVLEPHTLNHQFNLDQLSFEAINYIDDLEDSGADESILGQTATFLSNLESGIKNVCLVTALKNIPPSAIQSFIDILKNQAKTIAEDLIKPLYKSFNRPLIRRLMILDSRQTNYLSAAIFYPIGQHYGLLQLGTTEFTLVKLIKSLTPTEFAKTSGFELGYKFEIYPEGTVNIGIAKVYRQRWKTIGIQPGEIVRTIPLAPGQSEKVMTKITRRKKISKTNESTVEMEINQESTDSTKDSNDIVKEAANEEGWSVSAGASYGLGGLGFGGSLSGETSGSSSTSSKRTTSSLSEKMKKTASKMRSQTKVTVSTELESSFEETFTSEVSNTNDEVPITLQYHMLQHQYDVYTYLYAVKNVVYVAEEVPTANHINAYWVRRYDWIIGEALIDESYRETLNELIQDSDGLDIIGFSNQANPYTIMLKKAQDNFAAFQTTGNPDGVGGINVPDIYAEPQRQFDEYRKNEEIRRRTNSLRKLRHNRLFLHIKDNILHYCQAIWAKENNEQRMLRYKKERRTVPLIWEGSGIVNAELSEFEPTETRVSILKIIENYEPLGYVGNYAVFEIAPSNYTDNALINSNGNANEQIKITLQDLLDLIRVNYTNEEGTALMDPALRDFVSQAEGLVLNTISDDLVLDLLSYLPQLSAFLVDGEQVIRDEDGKLIYAISKDEWGEYQFKKNSTRRFLVDSNNLYMSIFLGNGAALEPFKLAHRYIDVLKANEERKAEILKNERRDLLKNTPNNFDPDISKVVVATNSKNEDLVGGLLGTENIPVDENT